MKKIINKLGLLDYYPYSTTYVHICVWATTKQSERKINNICYYIRNIGYVFVSLQNTLTLKLKDYETKFK